MLLVVAVAVDGKTQGSDDEDEKRDRGKRRFPTPQIESLLALDLRGEHNQKYPCDEHDNIKYVKCPLKARHFLATYL